MCRVTRQNVMEDNEHIVTHVESDSWSSNQFRFRSDSPEVVVLDDERPVSITGTLQKKKPIDVAGGGASDYASAADESLTFNANGLPCCVRLLPSRSSAPVFGTLFEKADPWKAIGHILGLESDSGENDENGELAVQYIEEECLVSQKATNIGLLPLASERTDSSDWSHSMKDLMLEEMDDNGYNAEPVEDEFEPLNDESEVESLGVEEDALSSASRRSSLLRSLIEEKDDSPSSQSESVGSSPAAGIDGNTKPQVRKRDKFPTDVSAIPSELSRRACQSPLPMAEDQGVRVGYMSPPTVLAIPELNRVDGKFLGPSLFDFHYDFDDDDED